MHGRIDLKLSQLLKEMKVLKSSPDSVTYSTMIYTFVLTRDYKRVFYFLSQSGHGQECAGDRY